MMRRSLVVGDMPVGGGEVLPYEGHEFRIMGRRAALVGDRAYCKACNSIGLIQMAGGTRRVRVRGVAIALEGDVVHCQCPTPPPIQSVFKAENWAEDGLHLTLPDSGPRLMTETLLTSALAPSASPLASSKTVADEGFTFADEHAEQTEKICPLMTNREFADLMKELGELALRLIDRRLRELEKWGRPERERVVEWFGHSDDELRQYLRSGLEACARVLRSLSAKNFVRYSPELMTHVGCLPSGNSNIAAEVCSPDTSTHTIGIGLKFCELADISAEKDSQLSTLIHEVTHFHDTFSSTDDVYTFFSAKRLAKTDRVKARRNGDNIAGYVVQGVIYGD